MIWNGETERQKIARLSEWHERFALFPTQVDTGEWVWLERYHARLYSNCRGGFSLETRLLNDIPAGGQVGEPPPPPKR